jgi:replicative DNA helicase
MKTPHNHEAERAVLAGVMLRNDTMGEIAGMLGPDDFHHPAHRAIWSAAEALHARRQAIDPVTLETRLRVTEELGLVGGLAGLGALCEQWSSGHHVAEYAEIVASVGRRRRLVMACQDVVDQGNEGVDEESDFIDEAERKILAAGTRLGAARHLMPSTVVHPTMSAMFERMKRKDPVIGIPSGITYLDHMIGGFQPGKLYVIAGRPGHGKSALAGNVVLSAATLLRQGRTYPSLTISLEMAPEEITERHIMTQTRKINHSPGLRDRVRSGRCTETDVRVLCQAGDRIHKSEMAVIDGAGMAAAELCGAARRWRTSKDCGPDRDALLAVDYLQLVRPTRGNKNYNREQEVAAVSREMKLLAKELRLPVLLLCQLNRGVEKREDHRPRMEDLRESGAIEQDADVIIFVHLPHKYIKDQQSAEYQACKDDAELIVEKQRGGETGVIGCKYYGAYYAFENRPGERDALEK